MHWCTALDLANVRRTVMEDSILQSLRSTCEGACPSGSNLEYDPEFLEMCRRSERRPELQYGSTIVESKDPIWPDVLDRCIALSRRTRDLRVGVRIVESLCHTSNWQGLAQGLELLTHWVVQLWDSVHPQLDPEDDCDPTARVGILSYIVSTELLLETLQTMPLVAHRTMGQVTLREWRNLFLSADQTTASRLTRNDVEAIFFEAEIGLLESNHAYLCRSIAAIDQLNHFLNSSLGTGLWSGQNLVETLQHAERVFRENRDARLLQVAKETVDIPQSEPAVAPVTTVPTAPIVSINTEQSVAGSVNQIAPAWTNTKIGSRSDATAAIDSICMYFEKNEPASPVPLLLKRAQKMIPMSFVEILQELAPTEGSHLLQSLISTGRLQS